MYAVFSKYSFYEIIYLERKGNFNTHTSTYVRTHAHTYSTHVLIYSSTDNEMLSRMKGQCARAITNVGLASVIINTIPALVECRWKGMEQP